MGSYPALRGIPLLKLISKFQSRCPDGPGYSAGYFLEVAERIGESGSDGVEFLKSQLSNPSAVKVRAAVYALAARTRAPETITMLLSFLGDKRPIVVAESIDGLRRNHHGASLKRILPLSSHPNPYIAGASLRYVSAFNRTRAKDLLIKSLKNPRQVVRANACDELDRLNVSEAIPHLTPLLRDPAKPVRQAARTAVDNLSAGRRSKKKR